MMNQDERTQGSSSEAARPQAQWQHRNDATVYRYINSGSGGTYTFSQDTPQHIGTSKCDTCVGVYFAIDDYRCFAAHINADTFTRDRELSRQTNGSTSTKIRDEVTCRLDEEQQESQWGPVSDRMRTTLVMVCPRMAWTIPMVGDAVSEAVQHWLGISDPQRPNPVGGFVTQHPGVDAVFFEIEAPTSSWYKRDEKENRAWEFCFRDE